MNAALLLAWELGFAWDQATELPALAAMSREEFDAEMAALELLVELLALEADARANP